MDVRAGIVVLTVVGVGLTAANGVLAYRAAQRRLRELSRRITSSDRYADEGAGRTSGPVALQPQRTAHDQADAVLHALRAGRGNLLLAGVGLLLSAAASIWALYV